MADKIGAADCRKIAPPARRDMPEGNAAGAVVALSFQTFLSQSAKAAVEAKAETRDHGQAAATRRRQRVLTSSLNGCYPMLDLAQVRTLLLAERSRDVGVLTEAVDAVLATSPEVSPLDIEMVFRDACSPIYLIAEPELTIVIGMPARRSALDRLGMSPQENRYALAGTTGHS